MAQRTRVDSGPRLLPATAVVISYFLVLAGATSACHEQVGTSVVEGGDMIHDDTGDDDSVSGDTLAGGEGPGDGFIPGDTFGWDCFTPADCTMPEPCEEASGAGCDGGVCVYQPTAATTVCVDGDPCTEDDACDGSGNCVGSDKVCGAPPAPSCQGEDYVYYVSLGGCEPTSGDCFEETIIACGANCVADCLNVCDGVPCPAQNFGCRVGNCEPVPQEPPPPIPECVYADAVGSLSCDTGAAAIEHCISGECRECATDDDCPACAGCGAGGYCDVALTDDDDCGTIYCDGLDQLPCRDYHHLTTARCEGLGDCKDANTGDCTDFTDAAAGTDCGLCATCDDSGGCTNVPVDDGACPVVDCEQYELSFPCRDYTDITTDRCKDFNDCKVALDDCTYVNNPVSCDDDSACTDPDTCVGGECLGGADQCVHPEYCVTGACLDADTSSEACETGGGFNYLSAFPGDATEGNCCGDDALEYYTYLRYYEGGWDGGASVASSYSVCCDSSSDCEAGISRTCISAGETIDDFDASAGDAYLCNARILWQCCVAEVCGQINAGGIDNLCERDDSDTEDYSWTTTVGAAGSELIRKQWCAPIDVDASTDDHCGAGMVQDAIDGPGGDNSGGYACCANANACVADGPTNTCVANNARAPGSPHWLCYNSFWLECADLDNFNGLEVGSWACTRSTPAWEAL